MVHLDGVVADTRRFGFWPRLHETWGAKSPNPAARTNQRTGPQIAALRAERDPAGAPRLDPDAALPAPAGDADELGHDRRRAEAGTVVALVYAFPRDSARDEITRIYL